MQHTRLRRSISVSLRWNTKLGKYGKYGKYGSCFIVALAALPIGSDRFRVERLDWVDGFWRLLLGMANDKTWCYLWTDLYSHWTCRLTRFAPICLYLLIYLLRSHLLAGCARFNGGGRIRVQQARAVFLKGQLQSHTQTTSTQI